MPGMTYIRPSYTQTDKHNSTRQAYAITAEKRPAKCPHLPDRTISARRQNDDGTIRHFYIVFYTSSQKKSMFAAHFVLRKEEERIFSKIASANSSEKSDQIALPDFHRSPRKDHPSPPLIPHFPVPHHAAFSSLIPIFPDTKFSPPSSEKIFVGVDFFTEYCYNESRISPPEKA